MKKKFTEEQVAFCAEAGRDGDAGGRGDPEDGDHGADILPVEEEVWGLGAERAEAPEAAGGGEPEAQADGFIGSHADPF